ncbi:MAG: heavy metal-binding domain-containing protein [Bacteroidota bacterium]
MILTTTNSLETHNITSYLGVVSGKSFTYAKKFKEMRPSAQPELVGRGEEGAREEIIAQAEELGANAIVGMSVDFEIDNGSIHVVFTGTAVKCRRK